MDSDEIEVIKDNYAKESFTVMQRSNSIGFVVEAIHNPKDKKERGLIRDITWHFQGNEVQLCNTELKYLDFLLNYLKQHAYTLVRREQP